MDEALLNQFVVGVSDVRIQRRLLETKDLISEKPLQTPTALELTNKEANALVPNKNSVEALHANKNVVPKFQKNRAKFKLNKLRGDYSQQKRRPTHGKRSTNNINSTVQCY